MALRTSYPKRDDGLSQINHPQEHPQDIGSGQEKSEGQLDIFDYQSVLPNPTIKNSRFRDDEDLIICLFFPFGI